MTMKESTGSSSNSRSSIGLPF